MTPRSSDVHCVSRKDFEPVVFPVSTMHFTGLAQHVVVDLTTGYGYLETSFKLFYSCLKTMGYAFNAAGVGFTVQVLDFAFEVV